MQTLSFAQARAQLAEVLRSVEAGQPPVVISRRGQAAGVLMSSEQFRQFNTQATGFAGRMNRWREQSLAAACSGDGSDPFADVRQREAGRDFTW